MKKNVLTFTALALLTVLGQNCAPDANIPTYADERKLVLPEKDYDYQSEVKSFLQDSLRATNTGFDIADSKRSGNGFFVDNKVATLGRVLFYDTKLSINNTVSCGSCHLQSKAFSDVGDVSTGFQGGKTTRNAMSIANPLLTNNLFWDSRSRSLNDMVLKPVQNHIEMGMEDVSYLANKLIATSYYPELFRKAFGKNEVSPEKINQALVAFLASMVTHNSKFDVGMTTKFGNFSPQELVGKDLFTSARLSCNKCHAGANFSLGDDTSFDNPYGGGSDENGTANIGLDMFYKDNGHGNGKFKIPSLRNVELTGPYMHDGRFKTLEDVVEHYNKDVKSHPNLDKNLKTANGEPRRLNLTALEKGALIAFLKTLTDPIYTTDVKYSDPFKN
jgi:cytochrome c peroxidase